MLNHSTIGPWPIIDPAVSKITTTATAVQTVIGSPLNVCLDTANLGSNPEAFVNKICTTEVSLLVNKQIAYGVCLAPLNTVTEVEEPMMVELSIAASAFQDEATAVGDMQMVPFMGYIDVAGAELVNDWLVGENLVTNYCLLPSVGNINTICTNQQILMKPILSADLARDKFLVVGFLLRNEQNSYNLYVDHAEYTISARYAYKGITTVDQNM